MEEADVEKAWRCVLQHDVLELASFCTADAQAKRPELSTLAPHITGEENQLVV